MKFSNIYSHIHQGKRDYQEDSMIFGDNFLLVADGVGGLAKGDVASGIVKDLWGETLMKKSIKILEIDADINLVIQSTIDSLLEYSTNNPESKGMSSTVACVLIIEDKMVAIHIGDSRIYHFGNDGTIKWMSRDHSLVQELINADVISEADARTHPKRNVVTRVLQAKEGYVPKPAIHIVEDAEDGDIVMVCSDGIIESWSDEGLISVINGNDTIDDIIAIIVDHCAENSKDNNTAVLAKVSIVYENDNVTSIESEENVINTDEEIINNSPKVIEKMEFEHSYQDEKSDDDMEEIITNNTIQLEANVGTGTSNEKDEGKDKRLNSNQFILTNRKWIKYALLAIVLILLGLYALKHFFYNR